MIDAKFLYVFLGRIIIILVYFKLYIVGLLGGKVYKTSCPRLSLWVHNLNFKFPEKFPDESGNVLSTDLNYLKYLIIYFLSAKSDVKI